MSARHTPGPWLADDGATDEEGRYFGIFAENGEPLAYLVECSPSCRVDLLPRDENAKPSWTSGPTERALRHLEGEQRFSEHRANALLMAASPQLLAALESSLDVLRFGGVNTHSHYEMSLAAIALAKGEPA